MNKPSIELKELNLWFNMHDSASIHSEIAYINHLDSNSLDLLGKVLFKTLNIILLHHHDGRCVLYSLLSEEERNILKVYPIIKNDFTFATYLAKEKGCNYRLNYDEEEAPFLVRFPWMSDKKFTLSEAKKYLKDIIEETEPIFKSLHSKIGDILNYLTILIDDVEKFKAYYESIDDIGKLGHKFANIINEYKVFTEEVSDGIMKSMLELKGDLCPMQIARNKKSWVYSMVRAVADSCDYEKPIFKGKEEAVEWFEKALEYFDLSATHKKHHNDFLNRSAVNRGSNPEEKRINPFYDKLIEAINNINEP